MINFQRIGWLREKGIFAADAVRKILYLEMVRLNMQVKNGSFDEFALRIKKHNYEIIVFGAGMIGTVTVPGILRRYGIEKQISCYIDNEKGGKTVQECGRPIYSVRYLKDINPNKYVLLIAVSRFFDVLEQLEKIENLKDISCYIIPMMCTTNFRPLESDCIKRESKFTIIPKKIHYMWFGNNKISDSLQYCINSWKKFCPDYEIIRWDESNYDIGKNPYMEQAYEKKMYGFIPDYARLDLLYHYGGIYLDTDVELIKNLDDMLYQEAFCCVEKWQTINFGGGSGSVKGNRAVGELLYAREKLSFIDENGSLNKNTCGYYDTKTLLKFGYKLSGTFQKVIDLNVYPYEYFHPYDYMSGRTDITEHTYGIHHFSGSWLDKAMKEANLKTSKEYERIYKMIM